MFGSKRSKTAQGAVQVMEPEKLRTDFACLSPHGVGALG